MKRLILSLFLLASVLSAHAATYTVTNINNAGAGSLRDSISQANANPGADTIDFDTAGVFSTARTITLAGTQLSITGAVTIDAPSAAAKRVTISGNLASRVFSVQLGGAGTVTLKHLTIRDGTTVDDGGGIQMASPAGSTLELVDCVVRESVARDGGGIYVGSSTLILMNSDVVFNDATRDGGGIHADGATVTISGGKVSDHRAVRGGGIFAKGGAAVAMTGGEVSFNQASGDGGGIRASGSSTVTLLGVSLTYNSADHGGGIAIHSATLEATNCIIARNTGSISGGGIHFNSGTARVKNCTVMANSNGVTGSPNGSGIRTETGGMSVGNTVIAQNPESGTSDVSGSFLSLGHNLIGFIGSIGLATGFTNGVDGDIVGGQLNSPAVDPRIDYIGTSTFPTFAPLPRSRCLEGGDSALVTNPLYGTPPFVDQAGNPRIRGVVDIGAVEGTFNAVITNDADSGAGSLRDALASSPTDIAFDPGYFGTVLRTITLTSGQIIINSDITLAGPAPGVKISGGNSSRIFSITGGAVTLRHVRVIDGNSTGDGGGIRVINNGTSLTLEDSGVSNSVATGRGGGLYMQDTATVSVTTSTFSGNVADDDGGGIHIGTGATFALTNSTVSGNSSKRGGGGIYSGGGTSTIINCTVAENIADSDNAGAAGNGGGIRRNAGTVNVGNTIVAKNTDASTGTEHPDVSGVFVSLGHNLIGKTNGLDGSSGVPFQNGVNGDIAGTIASPLLPQLGALALNPANSPTRVHPLLIASPARDAGDAALLTNAAWPSTPVANDQRGQYRTVGTAVDIGAVEYPDSDIVKLTVEEAFAGEQTLQHGSFRIRRSFGDGASLVVNLIIDPGSTASATDYTLSGASYTVTGPSTFTVTIPAGKTSVLLTLTPLPDAISEGIEVLSLTLAAGAGYAIDAAVTNTRTVTIYGNAYTVTSNANAGAGSLREAIGYANAGGGAVITIPQNASITLTGAELSIESGIEIIGNGSTINAGGLSRVFTVDYYGSSYGGGTVILRNLVITGGNAADVGGGVKAGVYSELEMRGCMVIGNFAGTKGGGIYAADYSTLTLMNCSVVDNIATVEGGGIRGYSATMTLTNVTVAGNQTPGGGGGISNYLGITQLTNCTITENLADSDSTGGISEDGGGIYAVAGSTVGLFNTVVSGNSDMSGTAGGFSVHPDISSFGVNFGGSSHNFIGNNLGTGAAFPAGMPGANGNYAGTFGNPLDAGLLRINRPTGTYYEFTIGSLLFDHGSNFFANAATDQRGYARIYNGTADIGAVEMDFLFVLNDASTGAGSLRQAIADAAVLGHGTVVFDTAFFSIPRTILPGVNGELVITSPIIISAPTDPARRLSVSGGNTDRVFRIAPASAAAIEFRSFDIINGSTASYGAGNRFGAGMLVGANATVTMTGCEVRDCSALAEGGGVIIAASGSLSAADGTFSGNHAGTQGGAILNLGTLTLNRVTLSNNTATLEGAGLGNAHLAMLTNCTFSNNRANSHGGAIYNLAGAADTLTLTHCTLTLNRANDDNTGGGTGGGIRRVSGIVNVRNTIISGNDALASTQDDISGTFTSLGNNLIGTASGGTGFTNGVNGDIIGANAYLGPLQFNGGRTLTHAILAGSAAINAASTIIGATDQRGLLRSGTPDIGAYELLTETYAYWAAHTFPSATNAGATQDYDGDGFTNSFEFGAGSDPLNALSGPGVTTIVIGSNFVVEFSASALAPLGYDTLRYSTNLVAWQNVATNLYQIVGVNPAQNAVIFRVTVPQSFEPIIFFRLERLP